MRVGVSSGLERVFVAGAAGFGQSAFRDIVCGGANGAVPYGQSNRAHPRVYLCFQQGRGQPTMVSHSPIYSPVDLQYIWHI
jgi:hypothetical protein